MSYHYYGQHVIRYRARLDEESEFKTAEEAENHDLSCALKILSVPPELPDLATPRMALALRILAEQAEKLSARTVSEAA